MKKAATPSRGIGNGSAGGGGGGGLFSRSPESRRCVRFPARSLPFSGEFATLGLTPSASKSDVKRAYKRLALKYHPDVMRGEKGVQEEEAFKEIKSAYETPIGADVVGAGCVQDPRYQMESARIVYPHRGFLMGDTMFKLVRTQE
uniref:DnaJ homolog subfamily B member 12 isoform X3 n=1 Tax=Elaeis guineensis var. tenera TaxID=51953 RepID=A0A6J0PMS1_ELAGV|nr:dnaJ homolog subfamily B member 12 isoform X3 [Elaeis guineensis]